MRTVGRGAGAHHTYITASEPVPNVHLAARDDGWMFEHRHVEGPHWRSFGDKPDGSGSVMAEYKLHDQGVQFDIGSMHDHMLRKHGPEAVQRLQDAVREHHGVSDYTPDETPQPTQQKRRVYYHGTTVEGVTHILPATQHRGNVTFPHVTSVEHAYATLDHRAAWSYAEKAWAATGSGRPRVYQVRPIGGHRHVEKDPTWDDERNISRGNNDSDRRSTKGWEVVREMKMPKHMGDPSEWDT